MFSTWRAWSMGIRPALEIVRAALEPPPVCATINDQKYDNRSGWSAALGTNP